jgi:predicted TIM-barrel fold metal-dependent hydrolase
MVEGESGLLAIGGPQERPHYEPTKRRLTWPNGAIATRGNANTASRSVGITRDMPGRGQAGTQRMIADPSAEALQVLSHSIPGLQAVDAEAGPPLARRTNDRLHEAVRGHPDRFSAFAVLPTANPRAAADKLERAVTQLGFKGAMVNGMTGGVFHDDKRFWPIWERAAALDVPIYIHPALPHPAVIEAYYKDYAQSHPSLLRAAWGFTVETATQGLRFVLSGVFDAHPGLKIILGHMGCRFCCGASAMGCARR